MTLIPTETDREGREITPQAGGLASTDLQRIRQALDHNVSDNTRAAYGSAWRSFEAWPQARAALTLPASPALVAAYLSHLAQERRLSVATVRLHQAALAAMHRAHGHPDPTDNEGVRRVLQDIARARGRPGPPAWARASPATPAAWAWPRTWPAPASISPLTFCQASQSSTRSWRSRPGLRQHHVVAGLAHAVADAGFGERVQFQRRHFGVPGVMDLDAKTTYLT